MSKISVSNYLIGLGMNDVNVDFVCFKELPIAISSLPKLRILNVGYALVALTLLWLFLKI